MRHRKGNKKLGKPTDQRIALLRSIVRSLFLENRIKTTDVRAKAAKRLAEKLITLAKCGDVHSRRQAIKLLPDKDVVRGIFSDLGAKYADRKGGYTRVVKLGFRRGDGAAVSLLELVD